MRVFLEDPTTDFVFKIIISFLVGALIGLERERTRIVMIEKKSQSKEYYSLPGIRSFGLLSVYGMLLSYTSYNIRFTDSRIVLTVFMTSLIFLIFFIYIYQRSMLGRRTGITTYIVMSMALILGFLVGIDKVYEAIAASVFITLILAIKPSLQAFVKEITYKELLSGLELGLFVFVLGPFFLIQHPKVFGIDLSSFYILFIVILSLSYLSYIAVKIKGAKALKYIAFLGGLINSEATTSNIANVLSTQNIGDKPLYKLMFNYVLLSITAMLLRNLLFYFILGYQLLTPNILLYIAGLIFLSMLAPLIISMKTILFEKEEYIREVKVTIENPLTFGVAVKVVLAYSTIFIVGFATASLLPPQYLLIVSIIGGFVNAGATLLTILTLTSIGDLPVHLTALLILAALASGVVNKIFFVRTAVRRSILLKATVKAVLFSLLSFILALIIAVLTQ